MTTVKERLLHFLTTLPNKKGGTGLTKGAFQTKVGMKPGSIANIGRSLHPDTVAKIKKHYPELNELWLLNGQPPMLLTGEGENLLPHKELSDDEHIPDEPGQFIKDERNRFITDGQHRFVSMGKEKINEMVDARGFSENIKSFDSLLEIHKIYADAHKVLVDSHKVIADAHKKSIETNAVFAEIINRKDSIEDGLKQSHQDDHSRIFAIEEALVELGMKLKVYDSKRGGHGEIYKFFDAELKKEQSKGSVDEAGKKGK